MTDIKERDWKRLRDLKPLALERFCVRVLADIDSINSDASLTPHERYLAIYALIQKRDKDIARIFDGLSRSSAIIKLRYMLEDGLLTEDEVAVFSRDIQYFVARWSSM